jgi:hypothetical protein
MERSTRPVVLDPTGHDIHAEAAQFAERGPATLVELPGEVVAWSITSQDVLQPLLSGL